MKGLSTDNKGVPLKPSGVHIVGSVPLSSSEEVLKRLSSSLPGRLLRIPDGETGVRHQFTQWQSNVFLPSPFIMHPQYSDSEERDNIHVGKQIALGPTRYDEVAISSYRDFVRLREEGIIESGTRFQVSLPTPINVLPVFVRPSYLAEVEPLYEALLLKAIRNIQDQIPPGDLSIQFDMALEFAMMEGVGGMFTPWFSPILDGLVERAVRLCESVDPSVELGLHLCYGDMGHRHFIEPNDTGKIVEVVNSICSKLQRPINWIHLPVPKSRKDQGYFEPLRSLLTLNETRLYLGLVHAFDKEGTIQRMEAAKEVTRNFGIATECGLGRTPCEDVDSILAISRAVSDTIR